MPAGEEQMANPTRYVRSPELERRTSLSRSTIGRLERAGRFPKRCKLSANAVGWLEDEVEAWLRERAESRSEQTAAARTGCSLEQRCDPTTLVNGTGKLRLADRPGRGVRQHDG
jgi:prophage regulatory protein